jgi:hypothetical protein
MFLLNAEKEITLMLLRKCLEFNLLMAAVLRITKKI